jgi:hypothetical protein
MTEDMLTFRGRKIWVLGPAVGGSYPPEMTREEITRLQRERRFIAHWENDRFGICGYGATPAAAVMAFKKKIAEGE